MSVRRADPSATNVCTIEVDRIGTTGAVLVTLSTSKGPLHRPCVSVAALNGHPHLEELPEVLRVIGLALTFQDAVMAHEVVRRLLEDLQPT